LRGKWFRVAIATFSGRTRKNAMKRAEEEKKQIPQSSASRGGERMPSMHPQADANGETLVKGPRGDERRE